ncbi:hypothetical protein, partial [Corallococcus sp. AB049A]|uniref:hypothetical protein n=1 Tax=Corallococcus sp. AB049A TaxID=2316721 RepID=UPI0013155B11
NTDEFSSTDDDQSDVKKIPPLPLTPEMSRSQDSDIPPLSPVEETETGSTRHRRHLHHRKSKKKRDKTADRESKHKHKKDRTRDKLPKEKVKEKKPIEQIHHPEKLLSFELSITKEQELRMGLASPIIASKKSSKSELISQIRYAEDNVDSTYTVMLTGM